MPLEVCHVICRMPPASWQSLLGRSCLLVLLSSPFWIKWMRLTLKRVMSKQHSFYVTFVVLTFWWVRYPFVEIPAGPPRCWVCFPFYPFYLNSFCTKGWSQRLLLWGIHHSCSWKWSKRTPASMINPGCETWGFTVRHAVMSREVTWFFLFFLVPEQFWPFICSIDFTGGSWFLQAVSCTNYQGIQMWVQMVKWYLLQFGNEMKW